MYWTGSKFKNKQIEKYFALVCFSTLLHYMISLKNSQHFVVQSEVKPKPIVTYYHDFPAS